MGRRSKPVAPVFPNDENGEVLRLMFEDGDDLSKPRIIEFCFAFPDRNKAIEFAAMVDERDLEVCISVYRERKCWQAIVKRHMVPTHRRITKLEQTLTERAASVGGNGDGWGCMHVDP
ncbi:MAG: ribonuclease E inhibitor RraB [Thermoguttaceae bacterium]